MCDNTNKKIIKHKKIGILGGTLDPIHIGHLLIAQSAFEQLKLDEVLFMPSGFPPHKDKNNISANVHRENMVKLAIIDNSFFRFSDFEMKRNGVIYTVDTLKLLKEKNEEDDYYFIMGADSLLSIETWHNPNELFNYCTIVVADRDSKDKEIKIMIKNLKHKYNASIVYIKSPMVDISSSDIRERVKKNMSIKYLVDDKVEKYIIENRLYSN